MSRRRPEPGPPLDEAALERLALAYAGRYMTTRARLNAYLRRKLRERGGDEHAPAAIERIVERMAELRYVDDQAFAGARAAGLERRGYGRQRVTLALRQAGVTSDDVAAAIGEEDEEAAWGALLRYAERRRLGPYAPPSDDPRQRQRAFAALVRAGHSPRLAGRLLAVPAGDFTDLINAE